MRGYSFRGRIYDWKELYKSPEAGVRLSVMNQKGQCGQAFQGSLRNEWQPDYRDAGFLLHSIFEEKLLENFKQERL